MLATSSGSDRNYGVARLEVIHIPPVMEAN